MVILGMCIRRSVCVCKCVSVHFIYIYVKLCVCLFCDASFKKKQMREMWHLIQKWSEKKLSVCLKSMSKRTYEESVICLKISRCEIMWMKLGMVI